MHNKTRFNITYNRTMNSKIKIRIAKLSDAKSIDQFRKEALASKKWIYTTTNKYNKKKFEKLKKNLGSKKPEMKMFIAIDTTENKVVGTTSYHFSRTGRMQHVARFGWGIHPEYEGRGICTKLLKFALEKAKNKSFKRAEAEIAVSNKGSIKVASKCGFKIEGRKEKALRTDEGKYVDLYVVGKIL